MCDGGGIQATLASTALQRISCAELPVLSFQSRVYAIHFTYANGRCSNIGIRCYQYRRTYQSQPPYYLQYHLVQISLKIITYWFITYGHSNQKVVSTTGGMTGIVYPEPSM